jgi:predicted transcriptional regulator
MTTATDRKLIDEAKAKLVTKAKESKSTVKSVEALDAIMANELLAKRSEIHDAKKALVEQLAEIDAVIKDMIGSSDELTVNGSKVASIARWRETALITDVVKSTFPLIEYPELYKRSAKSRLTVH